MKNLNRGVKRVCACLLAGIFLTGFGMVSDVWAADISSVSIAVSDNFGTDTPLEPDIEVSGSHYEMTDISWSKSASAWKPGTKVTATLTLEAETGKTFANSFTSSTCHVTGADYKSAVLKNDGTVLSVKIEYVPVIQLLAPETAGWKDTNKTKAMWSKVNYAESYQIRLYEGDLVIKGLDVSDTSVDLSEYMKDGASYYYEVRAVADSQSKRQYVLDSAYTVSDDMTVFGLSDHTSGDIKNYREGTQYQLEDGSFAVSCWILTEGKWYYFNENTWAVTGWNQINGAWYYMDDAGVMQTGWIKLGEVWYYLNENGAMQTGWVQGIPGNWYYLNADGSMAVNTVIDGYAVDAGGLWKAQ